MTPISTSPSQSQRLLDCGVDPKTADMYLSINLCEGENYGKYSTHILDKWTPIEYIMRQREQSPSWSLSALFALFDGEDCVSITKHYNREDKYRYSIDSPLKFAIPCLYASDPIECAVQMIEWLTSNDHQLNEIDK